MKKVFSEEVNKSSVEIKYNNNTEEFSEDEIKNGRVIRNTSLRKKTKEDGKRLSKNNDKNNEANDLSESQKDTLNIKSKHFENKQEYVFFDLFSMYAKNFLKNDGSKLKSSPSVPMISKPIDKI